MYLLHLSGYIRACDSLGKDSQPEVKLSTRRSSIISNMKVLSLLMIVVVALTALMGSSRAMPGPDALAYPDPSADPHRHYGGFGGFGRFGGGFGGFGGGFGRFGGGFGRGFGGGYYG
ncbi:neuropeptide-like protein 33 [Cherax quadricarinatus]|uniref:neuropeptide-like protein 33 n=1 Tax=Cherax quadricarinatus TaxID=27406 RepID=UPI00387EBEDD